jgi:CelD/BcsL family acetyltransferase involved in cellulose biosynthesis
VTIAQHVRGDTVACDLLQYRTSTISPVDDVDRLATSDHESRHSPLSSGPRSRGQSRYQIRLITSDEEFQSLESAWNQLLCQLHSTNIFLSFEWMWTWWRCLRRRKQLRLITATAGDRTVAIAPLMRDRRRIPFTPITFKELRFISTVPAAYSPSAFAGTLDVLIWPGYEDARDAIARYVLAEIRGFNCLRLHPVPAESPTLSVFRELGESLDSPTTVRKVFDNACLRVTGDWEAYYRQRKKKERWRLRRLAKKLGENYEVDCVEFTAPDQVEAATSCILQVEARSWKALHGVPINDLQYNGFYFELAKLMSQRGWLRVFVLRADGRPVAYQYYAQYNGRVAALKTSYDASFEKSAPGKVLIPLVFEKFFREGVTDVDLLWGNLDFKRKWADHLRPRREVCIYRTDWYSRLIRSLLTNQTLRRMWRFWREGWDGLRKRISLLTHSGLGGASRQAAPAGARAAKVGDGEGVHESERETATPSGVG